MKVRGNIFFSDRQHDIIFSDNDKDFICRDKDDKEDKMNEKNLSDWAALLNSPWSQADVKYEIEVNCKNGYDPIPENEPHWRCIYSTIGYEMIIAKCIGYGDSEEEAFQDCCKLLKYLQDTYNSEDESI